jgi:hypothetical protein
VFIAATRILAGDLRARTPIGGYKLILPERIRV